MHEKTPIRNVRIGVCFGLEPPLVCRSGLIVNFVQVTFVTANEANDDVDETFTAIGFAVAVAATVTEQHREGAVGCHILIRDQITVGQPTLELDVPSERVCRFEELNAGVEVVHRTRFRIELHLKFPSISKAD